jgi:hypothetical protein
MKFRSVVVASCAGLLFACPQVAAPTPKCDEPDAGAPQYEARLRFINLGREAVQVTLEGEDAGSWVQPLEHKNYVGHVTLIKQRVSVAARNFLPDGGREAVELPFEFDTTTGDLATFVLVDTTPQRISMNVTVGKQTQNATFGEKVNQGLANVEIEGGVDTGGDCAADLGGTAGTKVKISLRDDTSTDCPVEQYFTRPNGADEEATPYFVHGNDGLLVAWVPPAKVNAGLHAAGSALSQGASLLGGALPGGAVISAAVSSLYVLNAHGSHGTVTVALEDTVIAQDLASGAMVRIKPSVIASVQRKLKGKISHPGDTGMLAKFTVAGVTQTVVLGAAEIGPCKPPYLCDFLTDEDTLLTVSENVGGSATVLKSGRKGWDGTVKGGSRYVAASTTSVETRGCVAVFAQDDSCVMGAAAVSSVGNLAGGAGGGAAAASYAATGRVLQPPAKTLGVPVRFAIEEQGTVAQRFLWADPPGLTPAQGVKSSGFVVITPGAAADGTSIGRRALWFVDTSVTPWTVSAPALSL